MPEICELAENEDNGVAWVRCKIILNYYQSLLADNASVYEYRQNVPDCASLINKLVEPLDNMPIDFEVLRLQGSLQDISFVHEHLTDLGTLVPRT